MPPVASGTGKPVQFRLERHVVRIRIHSHFGGGFELVVADLVPVPERSAGVIAICLHLGLGRHQPSAWQWTRCPGDIGNGFDRQAQGTSKRLSGRHRLIDESSPRRTMVPCLRSLAIAWISRTRALSWSVPSISMVPSALVRR